MSSVNDRGERWLRRCLMAFVIVAVLGGVAAGILCWSYWNPTRWTDRYAVDVRLIPPDGRRIERVSYYVDPSAYFSDQELFWKDERYLLYEQRSVALAADGGFTVDVRCGGQRWLGGDNGYHQQPRSMLLVVAYDDGRFHHLVDVPHHDDEQRSMVIDLANPPDGPLERRAYPKD